VLTFVPFLPLLLLLLTSAPQSISDSPDSPDLLPNSPWELILLILLENQNQFVKSFGCKTDSYALIIYNILRYLFFYKLWLYKSGIIYINIT
jgi:hypothetical protein